MAFFDIDTRVQTILIAGALASVTVAAGCSRQQVADPVPDTLEVTDTIYSDDPPVDMLDMPEMVDPPPDVIDSPDVDEPADVDGDTDLDPADAGDAEEGDGVEAALPHGFLRTRLASARLGSGAVELKVHAHRGGQTTICWSASSGRIEAEGDSAIWHPPARSGVHAVQVTVRSDGAIGIETFKLKV